MKYPIRASLPLAILLAGIAVVALYVLQRVLLPGMAGSLFDRIVWGNAISPVILWLFFVAMVLLVAKRRQLGREQQLSKRFLAEIGPKLIDSTTRIEDVSDNASVFQSNLLSRRWMTYLSLNKGSDDSLNSEFDRYLTIAENEHLVNSYTAARFFVWALPIVGFIGTVWGIGLSISFFSDTMSSSQAGASVSALLQQNIPLVTKGLSTAFDTTLLALALSVPATGYLVMTERNEREYLLDLDDRWHEFVATVSTRFKELDNLEIDLADQGEQAWTHDPGGVHAQAVDESLRELREEAFDRYQRRFGEDHS